MAYTPLARTVRPSSTQHQASDAILLAIRVPRLHCFFWSSGKVLFLSPDKLSVSKTVTLPDNPAEDQIRKGERYYYSAMNCYQMWLSCSSCHDEGRPDGLNWDLQNDGTANPKQTKAHIYSSETPPTNVSGCRENAEVSSRAGYQFVGFRSRLR
jgi:hypothetical protein